ncbi:hypothetical protein GCM10011316_13820 [Roseibium aquae]|uniref:SurA N-terminal domain-containing protein n=1 Tax=Roseibium aquae TaxID=1323746 RepID=A0A916WYV5_9HYPH|nr:peptidylprolyl isomerase [Roseibium aquae]GGB43090.1 hypothetical protein GCM10011316_13820 [Roseibium aquae]
MRRPAALLLIVLMAALAPMIPWNASASIELVVNETPITSYDISQRSKLIRLTQRSSNSVARRQARQELIDEQLQLSEATRLGITISDAQLNEAYANVARGARLSPSQLSAALRQNGVDPQTLKDRLKAQLAWQQAVQRRFRSQITITESEVIAALRASNEETKNISIEYDLQRVIVVVPRNSSNGFRDKRLRESNQIRSAFDSCENPGAVLGQYSEVVVKPVGRRLETELPPNLREGVEATKVGGLTKPERSEVGFEMIAVCGKREIESDIAARTAMENELRAQEGESMSRRYLMELRRKATIIEK